MNLYIQKVYNKQFVLVLFYWDSFYLILHYHIRWMLALQLIVFVVIGAVD